MPHVVLVGTLDTKGSELRFLRDRIIEAGCQVILVDASVLLTSPDADVSSDDVARAAGEERAALATAADRGRAVSAMARGTAEVVRRLHAAGRLDAILGIGGSGGTALVSTAMRAVPVGVPKLLVSTMASGDTRPYVETTDLAMMYSVVDLAGINRLSERILVNAAAAASGMAQVAAGFRSALPPRTIVGATMFGVTTPCVATARQWLEERGCEVLVFHATGSGGQAMERLIGSGFIGGVLDVTTTELVDEIVGGVLSAGPNRLEAAGEQAVPQVVSVGATDMCNFGPLDSVPSAFRGRNLVEHNAAVPLMRTTAEECRAVGRLMATKLNRATGPVAVYLPLAGVSTLSTPGGPFHDPDADGALVDALRSGLRPDIEVVEMATHINDPEFARAMAARLLEMLEAVGASLGGALD
jgi:uncharacterized protein (UPF0261 family)